MPTPAPQRATGQGTDSPDPSFRTIVDLRRPGGPGEAARPDPIPNSAVKRFSAHGTVPQGPGESVAARPAKINASSLDHDNDTRRPRPPSDAAPPGAPHGDAGWSSPVARQAHNLKAAGSNPAPATKTLQHISFLRSALRGAFCVQQTCQHSVGKTQAPGGGD